MLHIISGYLSNFYTMYDFKELVIILFLYSIKYSAHGKILQAQVKFVRQLSVKAIQHHPIPPPFRVWGEIEFGITALFAIRRTDEL